jgi:hypothetical protein
MTCYRDSFKLLYVADDRKSQETNLLASKACYSDRFTLLYVDDVRTSQETHLRASKSCYRDSFMFYLSPKESITAIRALFLMWQKYRFFEKWCLLGCYAV